MARILIAGCGYVGVALARALAAGGHEVFGLRRHPERLPEGIRPIAVDLGDAAALRARLAGRVPSGEAKLHGLSYVVYAASPDGADEPSYRLCYRSGLSHLLEALDAAGERPRRVLLLSSTSVYERDDGAWVDEATPAEPRGFPGLLVREGERLLRASGTPSTVVRLGGIYGPGRTGLIERVRAGRAVARSVPIYTNRIHREDAAGALAHLIACAEAGRSIEPLYLGVDCEPADAAVVQAWLAGRLGVAPPKLVDSVPMEARGHRAGSKRCRNDRLLATGYGFRFPSFREGYAALLDAS